MTDQEIITEMDKIIARCIAVKVSLQERGQEIMFDSPISEKTNFKIENAREIIKYLSDLRIKHGLSKKPLQVTKSRINIIRARLQESCIDDAKKVIESRFVVWAHDEKFQDYLTIETLFRPSKYFKYLDGADAVISKAERHWDSGKKEGEMGSWTD